MLDFFTHLFDTNGFPPRWQCGYWTAGHGWLHILSDLGVWAAYFTIPFILVSFVVRRRDIPFRMVFWLFGAFILACGTTHLMEAIIFWYPAYRLAGLIKLFTAVVSWGTVAAMIPIIPQALALRSPSQLEQEVKRRTAQLQAEVEERKRVEHELLDERERLRKAQESLRDADRRKDEFLAVLAHELRNPLAPVRNALHVLQRADGDTSTATKAQAVLGRQLEHLIRLVDDLLDVSRIMRGKIALQRERTRLADVVTRAVEMAQQAIDAAGHRLTLALPDEPLELDADPIRLAQVLGNLLTNAAKYTDGPGSIDVSARREGDEIVVRVQDSGIGMPAELLPRVFEMFVQGDQSGGRSQGGLGIGLTLVRKLVELHGGAVTAHSDGPGRGSEFVIRLPAADNRQPTVGRTPEQDSSPGERRVPTARRVLVVDDNADAAESLAMILRHRGHEVQVVFDGTAALTVAKTHRPDAVFLDIGMPGLDGYEVARRLRREPEFAGLLLVALTGWGQEQDRRRAAEAGFDHHLTKPADLERVEQLLTPSEPAKT